MMNYSLILDTPRPIGIIQIIHGMHEHSRRYMELARYLNSRGFIIAALDHAGHGQRVENLDDLGRVECDFKRIVFEQLSLTNWLIDKFPHTPIFVYGHSMGSFIAQEHMKHNQSSVKGYILSGSSYKYFMWKVGRFVSLFLKSPEKSALLKKLVFMRANSRIKDPKTPYDWLSRDDKAVEEYMNDKFCSFTYTGDFYHNFFKFINSLYEQKSFSHVRRTLSVLILSGTGDPIGGYGKRAETLKKFYEFMNFHNVQLILYEGFRHELHNEIGKEKVFDDIFQWCQRKIETYQ